VIPKVAEDGDEAWHLHAQRYKKNGNVIAIHAPIAHILGLPCIQFVPRQSWASYPCVHARNIERVLNHESVHCAIQAITGSAANDGPHALFDRYAKRIGLSRSRWREVTG